MPFARWNSFQECVLEQKKLHDEESANRICGAIQARAEKGALLKSNKPMDVLYKADGELVIGGYASWEIRDPQNDVMTTQAQVNFLHKLFTLPKQYRNIMVKHGNLQIGEPLLKYTKPDGETVYSHVNEVGTYLIAKIRDTNWRSVQKVRDDIIKGKLSMYSISGDPIKFVVKKEHGETVRYLYDVDPWEVTVCERGVCQKASYTILSKEDTLAKANSYCPPCVNKWTDYYLKKGKPEPEAKEMAAKLVIKHYENKQPWPSINKCETNVCKAECCTFVTQYSKHETLDTIHYLELHGILVKAAPQGGYWLRMPIVCKNLDEESLECKDWEHRPDVCKNYPQHESPFINKSVCSLMRNLAPLAKSSDKPKIKKIMVSEQNDYEYESIFVKNWKKYVGDEKQ